ncbi:two-component system sensor histidine kinase CreC [Desulfovibrio sp. OttesenSCG-928-O18]|nr:two-component system sensor histidine kinase CreC [Desulfovibrio sp. OttesenSCG-928-O18]
MKLGTRLFISFFIVLAVCLYFPLNRLADTISIYYREGVEDSLADQANILAALVEEDLALGRFSAQNWQNAFSRAHGRTLTAQIYELNKRNVDSHVYITDKQGTVLFDSENPENIGKDFSTWRDVGLTLIGAYGARTTRVDTKDATTTRLYVAAPIRARGVSGDSEGEIIGALTVVKPTTNILYFVEGARFNIGKSGLLALAAAALLSLLVTTWLTGPIKRLTFYARGIRDGESPSFPRLDKSEIGELGTALAEMRETLEGKRYVEQYVQHLTHELKSPLSAIRGAAELLGEAAEAPASMDANQQKRFIANIDAQSRRIQEIVDRMLELSALENPSYQRADEEVSLHELVKGVCADKEPLLSARNLRLEMDAPQGTVVRADAFLLRQALANLVQNAAEFSPENGRITVAVERNDRTAALVVRDEGPGIPDYAGERVFEKFFSLQRPHTGQKSTGLGLNFVKQVALLHGGKAFLRNRTGGGAEAGVEILLR